MTKRGKSNFAAVKRALETRRVQVLESLGKLTGTALDASSKPVGDRVDDAAFDLELDSSYTIAEQEAEELRLINTALEKLDDGTYGICEECGQKVERPRLRALPYALLCLKCKQEEEMRQATGGAYY